MERPNLEIGLEAETFRSFYYLKEELADFCRKNRLPLSGGKKELTERIARFLENGEIPAAANSNTRSKKAAVTEIHEDMPIEADFVCSEVHRAFFKEKIGRSFTFNVAFQKWLKSNTGKTYKEAIEAYHRIIEDKKSNKTVIDSQFEYNTYIRDFFAANPGKTLDDAIKCWKYKKSLPGHNRYEPSDLTAL